MQMKAQARAPGPITGSGTGFKRAMRMHNARLAHLAQVGKWRCGTNAKQYKGNGSHIDPDYYIVGDWTSSLDIMNT